MESLQFSRVLEGFSGDQSDLIPVLQRVQAAYGYLSGDSLRKVARWLRMSENEIYGVASFYSQFRFSPPGRHSIKVCLGTACHVRGDMLSGTTLAAPVVAGVAGLIFLKNPEYSPDKVAAILKANSDPYDSPYYLGMGRVNAYKALMELNAEPEKPAAPEGTTSGKVGNHYNYTVSTVDVEGDQLYYLFDWGNGNTSGWLGPYDSNQPCTASYNWTEKGTYEIKAKAKDVFGLESEWSDPLPITMPKTYCLQGFINWLIYHFSLLNLLVKYCVI